MTSLSQLKSKVLVAGYPKSGNNWLSLLLIHGAGHTGSIDEITFGIKNKKLITRTESGAPQKRAYNIYIIRHPLDVMCSFWNYAIITNRNSYKSFNNYVSNFYAVKGVPNFGRLPWQKHVRNWLSIKPYVVKYDELLSNSEETLTGIYSYCNFDFDSETVISGLNKFSFSNMKNNEDEHAKEQDWKYFQKLRPTNVKAIQEGKRFYNKGKNFYYTELLSDAQIEQGKEIFGHYIKEFWPYAP